MDPPVKVALITGSSSGIGATVARLFARRGYRLTVTGINQERVDRVASDCSQLSPNGFRVLTIVADLSNPENGQLLVRRTINHFGRLDVLVNSAKVSYETHAADQSTLELFRKTMAINVDSVVRTTMEAIPHLERTSGNVVFISGLPQTKPAAAGYAYRMSKAAIQSYARCLAVDVAPKVRVNIVNQGQLDAPMFGPSPEALGAEGNFEWTSESLQMSSSQSNQIAGTVFYLASDEASFVNGAEISIDDRTFRTPYED